MTIGLLVLGALIIQPASGNAQSSLFPYQQQYQFAQEVLDQLDRWDHQLAFYTTRYFQRAPENGRSYPYPRLHDVTQIKRARGAYLAKTDWQALPMPQRLELMSLMDLLLQRWEQVEGMEKKWLSQLRWLPYHHRSRHVYLEQLRELENLSFEIRERLYQLQHIAHRRLQASLKSGPDLARMGRSLTQGKTLLRALQQADWTEYRQLEAACTSWSREMETHFQYICLHASQYPLAEYKNFYQVSLFRLLPRFQRIIQAFEGRDVNFLNEEFRQTIEEAYLFLDVAEIRMQRLQEKLLPAAKEGLTQVSP